MTLTNEEQTLRRQQANEFIELNELTSCDIKEFVNTYFKHNKEDNEYYSVLPVKDYKDKQGKTQKWGTKSSFELVDFYQLATTHKVIGKGKDGTDWEQPIKWEDAEYIEIRPRLNNANKTMCIIDFDGWKKGGDVSIDELIEKPEFPEELKDSAFFLSRTKSLPHFICWIDGLPKNIKLGQYIGVLKDFEGDILFNHAWERVDNLLYNVGKNCDLTTIHYDTMLTWLNSTDTAKKLIPQKPKEKKDTIVKETILKKREDDDTSIETNTTVSYSTDCLKIKELFLAILELEPTTFDKYNKWSELGYLIYNQTKGSDEGCDLFHELSNLRIAPDQVSFNTCSKQYNVTQKNRNKDDKLTISSLYHLLRQLDPDHILLEKNNIPMTKEQIRNTKSYKEYREIFEKTHFKLNNPICYCEIVNDKKKGKYIIIRNLQQFMELNRDIAGMPIYLVIGGLAPIPKKFHEIWLDDIDKKKYSQIKFDPSNKEEELEEGQLPQYNAFCGWVNDKDATPIKEEDSQFIQLMKWLLVDDQVFEYFKCWLSAIIQRPHIKTKIAPVLYSKTHGTGKNSLIDGCIAIIGKNLCGMVECIDDITKNFNAHLCNKLFIYGDEICANAKKVSDKLKAVITRPTQNLEKKGVDATEVDDLTNWVFTTNNENNIKVEDGDRRFAMIRCREEKQTEYSRASYEEIGNPEKLAQLFAFFKSYEQSPESIEKYGKFNIGSANAIITEYKKQMIYEHRPAYIQMLYKSTRDFVGTKYNASKLYELIQEWAKKHYCSANFTIQEFSKHSKDYLDIYKKRGNAGMKYVFPECKSELLKHLYNVDEPYYRYIHQLDDDFIPNFEPEPKTSNWIEDE
jgi:hypothetical protein